MNEMTPPEFEADGTKRGLPPCRILEDLSIFFGEMEEPNTIEGYRKTQEAKKVCKSCPYITECGQWAMEHPEERGVWGGLSEQERRNARKVQYRRSLLGMAKRS